MKEGKAIKVYSCYCISKDGSDQCAHFINQLNDGSYQDNTWGWRYEQYEYYIIKEINSEEQEHVWDSLIQLKEMLLLANSNCVERFFYQVGIKDI